MIDAIIQKCSKREVKDCLKAVRDLPYPEHDALVRVFEFNPDRVPDPLRSALNYYIK